MTDDIYDPSEYRIRYHPYILSFLFGGTLTVSCVNCQSINEELCEILPNLKFMQTGDDWGGCEWYECPVQNNKEAEIILIELKMRGYDINYKWRL